MYVYICTSPGKGVIMKHTQTFTGKPDYKKQKRSKDAMAIYEYECTDGHKFAKRVLMSDRDKPVQCTTCSEEALPSMKLYKQAFIIK